MAAGGLGAAGVLGAGAKAGINTSLAKLGAYAGKLGTSAIKNPLSALKQVSELYNTGTTVAQALGLSESPEDRLLREQRDSLKKRDALVSQELAKLSPNADQVQSGADFVNNLETGMNQAGAETAARGMGNSSYARSLYDSYGNRARLNYGVDSINNKNAAINQKLSILNMLSSPSDYQSMITNTRNQTTDANNALTAMGTAKGLGVADPFDQLSEMLGLSPKPVNAPISALGRLNYAGKSNPYKVVVPTLDTRGKF